MGSKRPSGSILGSSGEGFGRFWGEFESIFGWIFRKFEHNLDTAATLLCQDPRAVSRSLPERPNAQGSIPPAWETVNPKPTYLSFSELK